MTNVQFPAVIPREVDAAIAAACHTLETAEHQLKRCNSRATTLAEMAGIIPQPPLGFARLAPEHSAENIERAWEWVAELAADGDRGTIGMYNHPSELLVKRTERTAAVVAARAELDRLEKQYTGWSRFFVVTSSSGHVHSSRRCKTCRITTTYGWLPELSGKTEAEAVAELGPALCSVCFPSAPVEHVGGRLTKAQAAKRAA